MASALIRPALPADAAALARLHVEVWRETYRDLAPPEAIRLLDETRRAPYWRSFLTDADPLKGALIAEGFEEPAGLISFGPGDPAIFGDRGEIKHLYVRSAARGTGLGKRLLDAARARMKAAGHPAIGLAVVRGNTAARGFYAAQGGREIAEFRDPGPLWKSENILVAWPAF